MRDELHDQVPEDEPAYLAALPGVPNGGQRAGSGTGPKVRTGTDGIVNGVYCVYV